MNNDSYKIRAYIKYLMMRCEDNEVFEALRSLAIVALAFTTIVAIVLGLISLIHYFFCNNPEHAHSLIDCLILFLVGFGALGILLLRHFWYFCSNIYND